MTWKHLSKKETILNGIYRYQKSLAKTANKKLFRKQTNKKVQIVLLQPLPRVCI